MCGGAKAKSSSTSTYTPNSQAMGVYGNTLTQAQQTAQTAYNPATQQNVAGFNPQQLQAFQNAGTMQGGFQPLMDQAIQYGQAGAGPITPQQIQQYMDPYQQQVIDATMANVNHQNAVDQNRLRGNTAANYGMGNNRSGVAQAELMRGQGANRNQLVADLNSRGYTQALTAAQQDATRSQAAGNQFAQFAQGQQGMQMNDLAALLASGNQQQGQAQAVNDAASANASAQTMWPYQNNQWLAGIASALGPLMGGTTTGKQTTSQGKGGGQIAGAVMTGIGLLSDRDAKTNIKRVGYSDDGKPIYKYQYKGDPSGNFHIGFMSDEVEPDAVTTGADGLDRVDYDAATGYAAGGAVGGFQPRFSTAFEGMPELRPSQPVIPQLPEAKSGGSGEGGGQSGGGGMEQMFNMGKKARGGIESMMKSLDPAKGWGASIEPLGGGAGAGGKGLGSLGSFFGFADGGGVEGLDNRWMAENFPAGSGDGWTNIPKTRQGGGITDIMKMLDNLEARAFSGGNETPMTGLDEFADGGVIDDLSRFGFMPFNQDTPIADNMLFGDDAAMSGNDAGARFGFSPVEGVPPSGVDIPKGFAPQSIGRLQNDSNGMPMGKPTDIGPLKNNSDGSPAYAVEKPATTQTSFEIGDPAADASGKLRMSPEQKRAVMMRESGGNPNLINPKSGARGLMQIMPDTAREPGFGLAPLPEELLMDPAANKLFGEQYLDAMYKRYQGDFEAALIAYNAGPGNADKWIAAGRDDRALPRASETRPYVNDIIASLRGGEGVAPTGTATGKTRAAVGKSVGDSSTAARDSKGFAPAVLGGATNSSAPMATPANDNAASKSKKGKGGLIERWTGTEFNPFQFDENERMALIMAGLSTLGSGNLGTGGVEGMKHLTNARAADREEARLAAGPSTGDITEYNFAKGQGFGGSFMDYLASKKGSGSQSEFYKRATEAGLTPGSKEFNDYVLSGPAKAERAALPAEMGARIGLGDGFIERLPEVRDRLNKWSNQDRIDLALGRGDATALWRKIESGRDALVRQLTGAGIGAAEAENQTARYQITPTDTVKTMIDKMDGLEYDLKRSKAGGITGKTGYMAREFTGERTPGEEAPNVGKADRADKAPAAPPTPEGTTAPPVRIKNDAEYEALAPGTRFIDPNGKPRVKPKKAA